MLIPVDVNVSERGFAADAQHRGDWPTGTENRPVPKRGGGILSGWSDVPLRVQRRTSRDGQTPAVWTRRRARDRGGIGAPALIRCLGSLTPGAHPPHSLPAVDRIRVAHARTYPRLYGRFRAPQKEIELAEAIASGVWWLHGTRGSNVFLAETTSGGLVLFDAGFARSFDGIVDDVESIRPGARVTHLFLTHNHVDHAGAAASLRQHYGALVVAGAGDCEFTDSTGPYTLREQVGASHRRQRALQRILRRGAAVGEVIADRPLSGAVEVAGVRAVPTPGHTPGSYCYVLPDRDLAFVGDLVISHPGGLSRPMKTANDDDAEYLRSLRAFAQCAPDRGCPGHGAMVQHDFREQLLTLAAFSRRGVLSPAGAWGRGVRLWGFARGISRERRSGLPGAAKPRRER